MHHRTVKRQDYGPRTIWFGRTVLRLLGWKVLGSRPEAGKCMIVCAPHASNWDIFYALLASMALRTPAVFMMKASWFFWPLGPVFRWMGGIPVDRSKRSSAVQQMVQAFRESEKLRVLIAPSGTRKNLTSWRTGFYWIAKEAGVPIVTGIINYRTKTVGLGPTIALTGDLDTDFAKIRAFYQEHAGICPECRHESAGAPPDPAAPS